MCLGLEIATAIRGEPSPGCCRTMQSVYIAHWVLCRAARASRRKASHPAAKNAIHKKQSSYIFHCLYDWTRQSPVEEKKMTACTQSAWWRHRISWCEHTLMSAAIKCVHPQWRHNKRPMMSSSVLHGVYQKAIDYINKWKNMQLRGLSWACLQPIVFYFNFFRPNGDTWPAWVQLGTPNVVQIYLTFSRYRVTGDLSQKGIIRLFFTFGFGWHFLVSVR